MCVGQGGINQYYLYTQILHKVSLRSLMAPGLNMTMNFYLYFLFVSTSSTCLTQLDILTLLLIEALFFTLAFFLFYSLQAYVSKCQLFNILGISSCEGQY